jgi:hypothetical protein
MVNGDSSIELWLKVRCDAGSVSPAAVDLDDLPFAIHHLPIFKR